MKIVINACFGGFSLSPRAIARLAELQGKPCFFFAHKPGEGIDDLEHITLEEARQRSMYVCAFTIPNPSSVGERWAEMSTEERQASNTRYEEVCLDDSPKDRTNPLLVQVVEELGEEANGQFSELKVIEIPDDVKWEIEGYHGIESVHEVHRSWS